MPSWIRTPKALSGLGAPATVITFYVGLMQKDGQTRVTPTMVRGVTKMLETRFGGFTLTKGRGRWRGAKRFDEPTYVLTTVQPATTGCSQIHAKAALAAKIAAKAANQESVLVVTTCDGGRVERDYVSP